MNKQIDGDLTFIPLKFCLLFNDCDLILFSLSLYYFLFCPQFKIKTFMVIIYNSTCFFSSFFIAFKVKINLSQNFPIDLSKDKTKFSSKFIFLFHKTRCNPFKSSRKITGLLRNNIKLLRRERKNNHSFHSTRISKVK